MSLKNVELVEGHKKMPLMSLPVRTAALQLSDARVLWSPGSMLSTEQLRSLGEITDIVAPSLFHTAGVPGAVAAFPKATVWGPIGADNKHPGIVWRLLGVDRWPYDEELAHLPLGGMPTVNESLFLHEASRSLFAADLVFNVERPKGLGAAIIMRLFGTYGRFAVSRLMLMTVKDRGRFVRSLEAVMARAFDHVVPSHGAIVMEDGKARLAEALRAKKLV